MQDSRSTAQGIVPEAESPGRAGRPRVHSDPSESRQGELVDTTGAWTWARFVWDSWSKPWALGSEHESPGRAGDPMDPTTRA